jgi:hypothetical protein
VRCSGVVYAATVAPSTTPLHSLPGLNSTTLGNVKRKTALAGIPGGTVFPSALDHINPELSLADYLFRSASRPAA